METRAGEIAVHYVEHGAGRPVLVLHGAGVDHREPEACFEPERVMDERAQAGRVSQMRLAGEAPDREQVLAS
jgi:hypothetical protein